MRRIADPDFGVKPEERKGIMAQRRIDRGVWRPVPALAALLLLAALLSTAPAAAQQATPAQQNAIRQACPADYRVHCANVPAAGQAAFLCLERNLAQLSPACQNAVAAVGGAATPRAAAPRGAPAAAAAPSVSTTASPAPMTVRQELAVLRHSCGSDFRALCSGVPLGGGRAIACLRAHAGSLSPQCGEALSAARGSR
jgi:hypothetical protein